MNGIYIFFNTIVSYVGIYYYFVGPLYSISFNDFPGDVTADASNTTLNFVV